MASFSPSFFRGKLPLCWIAVASSLVLGTAVATAAPLLYVANAQDKTLSVLDAASNSVVGGPIAVGDRPTGVAINSAGTRVYVANYYDSSVSVVDTGTKAVVATVMNITSAHSVVLNAAGTRLFVAAGYYIYVIDTATSTLIGSPIGLASADSTGCPTASGERMAVDHSGTRLYVATIDACPGADPYLAQGAVSVVDTQAGSALRSISVGRFPTSATINPAGNRVYVTNWVDGTLSIIDTATNTVSQEITLGPDNFPINSVINAAGTRLYVANNGSSTVSVIDTTTNQEAVGDIPVGNEASDLALTTDGTRLYVTNQGSNNVSVIDTATNLVLGAPIAVGSGPFSIAVTASGPAVDLDQHGLTGSWYNPATGGQGFEIEVYPDLNGAGQGLLFAGWFTYDTTAAGGRRWYGLTGNVSKANPSGELQIFSVEGGNLNAPPSLGANGPLGRATIQFSDCNTGSLIYNFTDGSGRLGTIPLSRLTPNVTCSAGGDNGNAASDYLLSGNWFNPDTSGQGLIFDFSPSIDIVFAAWYTFMPHGQQIGGPASQQWFTLQSNQFVPGMTSLDNIAIVETTGGTFDQPTPTTSAQVGSARIAFTSCSTMALSYTFTAGENAGLAGTINLQRVGPTPAGCSL